VLTSRDERVLVGVAMAASRLRLARVAGAVLDRDDAVTAALLEAGEHPDRFKQLVEVLYRHDGHRWQLNLLDLVTELSQQAAERRGEPRTYRWPTTGRA
jgi:hypothetical protein